MHLAIEKGYELFAGKIIDQGYNLSAKNSEGKTPLHIAISNGCEDTVENIFYYYNNHHSNVKLNIADNNGETPLHLAIEKGYELFAGKIIDQGYNLSAKNSEGKTPLHIAIDKGYSNIEAALLRETKVQKESNTTSESNTDQCQYNYSDMNNDDLDVCGVVITDNE